MTQLTGSDWPYCDSSAPAAVAGEKDACGVGFLAQLQGERSHWVLQQALRGLGCMEHRGGCGGDGDSGDGAGVLCEIPLGVSQSDLARSRECQRSRHDVSAKRSRPPCRRSAIL